MPEDPSRPEPCPPQFNLAEYVLAAGRATPEKIALAVVGPSRSERWSFARLEAGVRGMAQALSQRAEPGAFVLLRLGNSPLFPVTFLGAIAAGLIPLPSAAGLTRGEISRLCALVPLSLILAEDGVSLPENDAPVLSDLSTMIEGPQGGYVMGDPNRLAYGIFTSGSSGVPKAVGHAHRAIWARRMMREGWYGLTGEDRVMHSGAFNWTYTLGTGLLDPWAMGAAAVIPHADVGLEALPLLIGRHDVSIFASVPGVYRKLLKLPDGLDLPKLRHGLSAGESLAPTLRKAWQDATGSDLHEALGMSECSTYLSSSPRDPAPMGAIGSVQPGRHVALLGANGAPVAEGEEGELAIAADEQGLMLGYLEDGTPNLPLDRGYFRTGDLALRAEDGSFQGRGRRDDLITAGGFRIAPSEIEAAFDGLPPCAAFTAEVSEGTFVVALAVEGAFSEAEFRERALAHLAAYKRPRLYHRLDALPRSANGKLMRKALAALWKDAAS